MSDPAATYRAQAEADLDGELEAGLDAIIAGGGAPMAEPARAVGPGSQEAASGRRADMGVAEIARQAVGGFIDAVKNVSDAFSPFEFDDRGVAVRAFGRDLSPGESALATFAAGATGVGTAGAAMPEIDAPETPVGGVVRSVATFFAPYAAASKAIQASGIAASPAAVGFAATAVTEALASDPERDRPIFDALKKVPGLEGPAMEYLASDEGSGAENRLKNALEGVVGAALGEFVLRGLKGVREWRKARNALRATDVGEGEIIGEASGPASSGSRRASEGAARRSVEKEQAKIAADALKAARERSDADLLDRFRRRKQRRIGAEPPAADEIPVNLDRFDAPPEVKRLLDETLQADADAVNKARGGAKRTFKDIEAEADKRLRDDALGELNAILSRKADEPFDSVRLTIGRKLWVAAAEQLHEASKIASGPNATEIDLAAFLEARGRLYVIQQAVKGAQTQAARSTAANRIAVGGEGFAKKLTAAIDREGGADSVRMQAAIVSGLDDGGKLASFVEKAETQSIADKLIEIGIAAKLWSPLTHAANTVGNTNGLFNAVVERKAAELLDGAVVPGEADEMVTAMRATLPDAWRLMRDAFRDGEVSGALAGELGPDHVGRNLGALAFRSDRSGLLRGLDFIRHTANVALKMPFRGLYAQDTFFKALGYRAELRALLKREAVGRGLSDDETARFIADGLQNPPEELVASAQEFMREVTYTSRLGAFGRKGLSFVGHEFNKGMAYEGAYVRTLIPFVSTPVNIAKFALKRTPVAAIANAMDKEIRAGGARADVALAKLGVGTLVGMTAFDMVLTGDMSGYGPSSTGRRAVWLSAGYRPYSFHFTQDDGSVVAYSYARLDPIGMILGLYADASEIIASTDEPTDESDSLPALVTLALVRNLTSKTYLQTLTEAFAAVSDKTPGRMERFFSRFVAGNVPFQSLAGTVERITDPIRSDTKADGFVRGIVNEIRAKTPGLSEALPPMRDLYGEPIVSAPGMNGALQGLWTGFIPVERSVINDPVRVAVYESGAAVSMPRREIMNVELSPEQYSRYVELQGKLAYEELKQLTQSPAWKRMTTGDGGEQSYWVDRTFSTARSQAAEQMVFEDDTLRKAIYDARDAREAALTGATR